MAISTAPSCAVAESGGPEDFGSELPETDRPAGPSEDGRTQGPGLELKLAYDTRFPGLDEFEDDRLADLIQESSQLVALEGRPTATYTGLLRRTESDRDRFEMVLRSQGYYDGEVTFEIDDTASPVVVAVTVIPGPQYRLTAYDIAWVGGEPAIDDIDPGLELGMPARAEPIAQAQRRLVSVLRERGRPFAKVASRVAKINRETRTMTVDLTLDAGPPASFGATAIEGLETLDPAFVRGKIPWREGESFDTKKVEELRTTLLGLSMFGSVKIETAEAVRNDGSLPVTVTLTEAKQRSVGAGGAFSTSEGFLLDVFWEHRNLLGAAETLSVSAEVGTLSQRLGANFRKPDFRQIDQDLLASSTYLRTNSDAFDESTWSNFLGLERKLSDRWRISGGGLFEISRITDQTSPESFQLFGVPLKATRDNRDDVLNPTKGSVLGFEVTPYTGHGSETLTFALGRITASSYLALDRRRRIVLAGRVRLASLAGEETGVIPANKRLYSGGGGSIRGYEFQKVGPLDGENDPVGGRSLLEVGLELRLRVTDEIGIVPFVEAGNVWDDSVPELPGRLQWAAGLGLRYYTAIGPARIDVALPINKRRNVDDDFQLYFSLGQAF